MAQPQLQTLSTPVSIGAQAIQRYLGNGAPRIANPNPVSPTGVLPGGTLGGDGATPLAYSTNTDAGNLAARNLQLQGPGGGGYGGVGTMEADYGNQGGGTALDQVRMQTGPTQQTAQGGVVQPVPVQRPDWGSYFRQRMGPPTGARAARPPVMMRQQRLRSGTY